MLTRNRFETASAVHALSVYPLPFYTEHDAVNFDVAFPSEIPRSPPSSTLTQVLSGEASLRKGIRSSKAGDVDPILHFLPIAREFARLLQSDPFRNGRRVDRVRPETEPPLFVVRDIKSPRREHASRHPVL